MGTLRLFVFDVKTVRMDKAGTGSRETWRDVEKREAGCKQDYIRKAATLDRKFAHIETNNNLSPMQ